MWTVDLQDPAYPARLARVADAPPALYVRGTLGSHERVVALVGARAASGHGMGRAHDLAAGLAKRGVLVISGGAVGIDAAAHRGALSVGAPTAVVLATGLDAPYPARHKPLFDEVVRAGGALVTSFSTGAPLARWHFPRRNRVLAGLADAIVIVEASPASGTLYTAEAARDYGRVLGACPGSAGSDALLAQGASLIESADDVLSALAGNPRLAQAASPDPQSDEGLVLGALDGRAPRDVATAGRLAGMDAARAASALAALELDGLALPVPGGLFVRSALADRML